MHLYLIAWAVFDVVFAVAWMRWYPGREDRDA